MYKGQILIKSDIFISSSINKDCVNFYRFFLREETTSASLLFCLCRERERDVHVCIVLLTTTARYELHTGEEKDLVID